MLDFYLHIINIIKILEIQGNGAWTLMHVYLFTLQRINSTSCQVICVQI